MLQDARKQGLHERHSVEGLWILAFGIGCFRMPILLALQASRLGRLSQVQSDSILDERKRKFHPGNIDDGYFARV